MKLTVVGCSGSFPGPQSPASCYLVEADGYTALLDLGNGALGYLARHIDIRAVDAVLLSHLHADHCLDLCSMYVARTYHPEPSLPRVTVYGSTGVEERLRAGYGLDAEPHLERVYDFIEWDAGSSYKVGPLSVTVASVAHPVPAYAMRVMHGGKVLVYSGDTGPCDALAELARGADLFLCEASFVEGGANPPDLHLTGREAGQHAKLAGVGRLVLTHVPPWHDPTDAVAEAQAVYDGPVEAAQSGAVYDI
jgi:ribonuclease BN (tRNA processing enzyme)